MEENDRAQQDIKTGEQGPGYGERPPSPEPGHPAEETQPPGGVEPGSHEHPEDVRQPEDEERDETSTESPSGPPDPDNG